MPVDRATASVPHMPALGDGMTGSAGRSANRLCRPQRSGERSCQGDKTSGEESGHAFGGKQQPAGRSKTSEAGRSQSPRLSSPRLACREKGSIQSEWLDHELPACGLVGPAHA